jgi:hypothetical protein
VAVRAGLVGVALDGVLDTGTADGLPAGLAGAEAVVGASPAGAAMPSTCCGVLPQAAVRPARATATESWTGRCIGGSLSQLVSSGVMRRPVLWFCILITKV